MENVSAGDTVRHTTRIGLNGGVAFNVLKVENDRAYCDFFDENRVDRQDWFNVADLIVVNKAKGAFVEG